MSPHTAARFGCGVILAIGRRRRAGQSGAGFDEFRAVEKLDKSDHVAAAAALAAIKDLFAGVDAEPIVTAAFRARAGALDLAAQFDAAARELVFDRYSARPFNPMFKNRRVTAGHVSNSKGDLIADRPEAALFLLLLYRPADAAARAITRMFAGFPKGDTCKPPVAPSRRFLPLGRSPGGGLARGRATKS
jgi:hypothetical protein